MQFLKHLIEICKIRELEASLKRKNLPFYKILL